MAKLLHCFIVAWLIMLLFPTKIFAGLTINEIYPAPATGDYEWVELYNNESFEVDLSQYALYDLANNKIKLPPLVLPGNNFSIATSSSILNNSGDTVYLKNNLDEILETVSYPSGITADKSYTKCPDGSGQWFSSNVVTKSTSNSPACLILTPTDNPTPIPTPPLSPTTEPTSIPTVEPTITSYNNIYLSEVMVNPPTGEKEWVEIYNQNDFSVNLDNWYVDDLESSGSSPKIFSIVIDSKSYQVFELTSSMFNNDGDSIRLLDFSRNLKDSFEYVNSEKGKSWGRVNFASDQFCLQLPTKNLPNDRCLNSTTATTTIKPTPSPKPMVNKTSSVSLKPTVKTITNKSSAFVPSPVRRLSNQPWSILGVSQQKPINKYQLTTSVLSLVSLTHSILTIVSLFLKIKIHEGI